MESSPDGRRSMPPSPRTPVSPSSKNKPFDDAEQSDKIRLIVRIQSNIRRYRTVSTLSQNSEKRRLIVEELCDTERHYVNNLRSLLQHYEQPLRQLFQLSLTSKTVAPLNQQQIDIMFSELPNILDCHDQNLKALTSKVSRWSMLQGISDVFLGISQKMRSCYVVYANTYREAMSILRTESEREDFAKFLHEAQRKTFNKFALQDLLIMPIQRFPHYILLLSRLRDNTPLQHPDRAALDEVIEEVRSLSAYVDDQQSEAQRRQNVLILQDNLRANGYFVSIESQSLEKQHDIVLMDVSGARIARSVFLFSRSLLCVKMDRSNLSQRPISNETSVELEWTFDLTEITSVSLKDRVLGKRDPTKLADDIARLEKQCGVEKKMIASAHTISQAYLANRDSSHSGWAMIEADEAESRLSALTKELNALKLVHSTESQTYGIQIHVTSGAASGFMTTILFAQADERDAFFRALSALSNEAHQPSISRSSLELTSAGEQALVWHIAPDNVMQASVTSVMAVTAVPGMERMTKLTFTLERRARASGAPPNPGAALLRKTTGIKGRGLKAVTKKGLSVRWDADVVSIAGGDRNIVHAILLNHALVCGSPTVTSMSNTQATTPQLEGIRFRLEWILPIPLIVVTPFELAPGQGDTDPDVLGSKIRQVQRLIEAETQMLSASYKIAANSRSNSLMPIARRGSSVRRSSVVIKQVRELNEETVRRIETLRAQLQAFQHLQALYSAPFGVCLGIRGSERRLEIAFASNAARTSFLERIESMQRQSVKRFARSAKRMSLEKTSPSLDALDDDVSNEELEALTELIHQAIQRSGKGDATHIFAASQDYLAMTEDELMFLAGERVDVLAVLNDECWLCSCEGVIGVSAPRLILPLHEYGLDYIPQFRRSTTTKYVVKNPPIGKHAAHGELGDLALDDVVMVAEKSLPKRPGMWLAKCKGVIGLIAPAVLGAEA